MSAVSGTAVARAAQPWNNPGVCRAKQALARVSADGTGGPGISTQVSNKRLPAPMPPLITLLRLNEKKGVPPVPPRRKQALARVSPEQHPCAVARPPRAIRRVIRHPVASPRPEVTEA